MGGGVGGGGWRRVGVGMGGVEGGGVVGGVRRGGGGRVGGGRGRVSPGARGVGGSMAVADTTDGEALAAGLVSHSHGGKGEDSDEGLSKLTF